jgi:DNA-binding response OmpR family regulator
MCDTMTTRILVIDNDDPARENFVTNLNVGLDDAAWQVVGYPYTDFDLAALVQLHPDLLILDFNSRYGNIGWQFLQMLKMEDATANIPILITTTAIRFSAAMEDFLATRYIRVIYKPFDPDSFLPLIKNTILLASQAGNLFSSDRPLPILVVEDTADLQEALTTVLRLEGYLVVTADNGMFALDALYYTEHSLILLDMKMPVMNGFEFLKIYERQLRPHTPVIILSGEHDILSQVFPPFVIGVIPKPYSVSELLATVKNYALPV